MRLVKLVLLSCFVFPNQVNAQSNFSLDDTLHRAVYPSTDPVFYSWFEITNHTGQDLQLRWVRSYDTPYPSAWTNNMQVLDSNYATTVDSADFTLPAVAGFSDYILCFNFPNNTVDSARVRVTVYDPANPSDRVSGIYNYVTYALSYVGEHHASESPILFPNPTEDGIVFLRDHAVHKFDYADCFDITGKHVSRTILTNRTSFDLSGGLNGTYFIRLTDKSKNEEVTEKLLFIHD